MITRFPETKLGQQLMDINPIQLHGMIGILKFKLLFFNKLPWKYKIYMHTKINNYRDDIIHKKMEENRRRSLSIIENMHLAYLLRIT